MEWVWNGYGMSMEWVWNKYGISMEWVWNGYGISMEWVWNEYGISMEWVWNEYGTSMEWVWNDGEFPQMWKLSAIEINSYIIRIKIVLDKYWLVLPWNRSNYLTRGMEHPTWTIACGGRPRAIVQLGCSIPRVKWLIYSMAKPVNIFFFFYLYTLLKLVYIYLFYYFSKLFQMVKYTTAADLSMRGWLCL